MTRLLVLWGLWVVHWHYITMATFWDFCQKCICHKNSSIKNRWKWNSSVILISIPVEKQLNFAFGTLKSLINEQGGYVVFLVLSQYSFIRDFRVLDGINIQNIKLKSNLNQKRHWTICNRNQKLISFTKKNNSSNGGINVYLVS